MAGRAEAFSCAPGRAGWRYVSDRLDLACDTEFRPVRFVVTAADGSTLRGGGARLDDGTPLLVWAHPDGSEAERQEQHVVAQVLLTSSPGSWVAAVKAVVRSGRRDLVITSLTVDLSGEGVRTVRQQHRCHLVATSTHPTDADPLRVQEWHLVERESGQRRTLHLAGDVLVAADGVPQPGQSVEVAELESPPTLDRTP